MSRKKHTEEENREIFREFGVGDSGYVKKVEAQTLREQFPELKDQLQETEGFVFVGLAANGDLIIVSENPSDIRDRFREDQLYMETLH